MLLTCPSARCLALNDKGERVCAECGRHLLVCVDAGYEVAFLPDHPLAARNGRVRVHRVIAEKKIGRSLLPGEVVHHIDGDRLNNDPANLAVMTNSEHSKLHWRLRRGEAA